MSKPSGTLHKLHDEYGIPAIDAETQCQLLDSEHTSDDCATQEHGLQEVSDDSDTESDDDPDLPLAAIRVILRQLGVPSTGSATEVQRRYNRLLLPSKSEHNSVSSRPSIYLRCSPHLLAFSDVSSPSPIPMLDNEYSMNLTSCPFARRVACPEEDHASRQSQWSPVIRMPTFPTTYSIATARELSRHYLHEATSRLRPTKWHKRTDHNICATSACCKCWSKRKTERSSVFSYFKSNEIGRGVQRTKSRHCKNRERECCGVAW
jgi:hypothetical protein